MTTNYQRLIAATIGTTDNSLTALVEEFMREGRSGLDGLPLHLFEAEAWAAYAEVIALEPEELELICQQYGIAVPNLTTA